MNKFFTLLLCAFALIINAQTAPDWQWLRGGGSQFRAINSNTSDTHDYLMGMEVDDSSNVYLAGSLINETSAARENYLHKRYNRQIL